MSRGRARTTLGAASLFALVFAPYGAAAEGTARSMIMVEGTQAADQSDLDPDDFLWEKLPGRCCFYGGPDPLDPSKWLGAHTCDQCTVWDLPTNFCHTSAGACSECGMTLYCGPTPPLVAGNKVCTGKSRVGNGCEDTLGTGVCRLSAGRRRRLPPSAPLFCVLPVGCGCVRAVLGASFNH